MRVQFNLPARREPLRKAIEFLVALNRDWLRRAGGRVPMLYQTDVVYEREGRTIAGRPKEVFRQIPEVLRRGEGDCEDLAAWRIAELRERGINAQPRITKHGNFFHVAVRLPDGRIDDPSKRLGMKGVA